MVDGSQIVIPYPGMLELIHGSDAPAVRAARHPDTHYTGQVQRLELVCLQLQINF